MILGQMKKLGLGKLLFGTFMIRTLSTQNMCVFTRGKRIQRANSKTTQKIFSLQNENIMTSLIA